MHLNDQHELELLLRRTPVAILESKEEPRLLQLLTQAAIHLQLPLFAWSIVDGLRRAEAGFGRMTGTDEPHEVLRHIRALDKPGLFVLLDFHPFLDDPLHVRLIKEIAQSYETSPRTLIFISHALELPAEIRHLATRFELSLPSRAALRQLIKDEARAWQERNHGRRLKVDREALAMLTQNLSGLTLSDARRLVRTAIEDDGAISQSDLPEVAKAKHRLLGQDGVISFEYDTASFAEVGGLRHLKDWLGKRLPALRNQKASADTPKGFLLLGVQGAGKSLAAKATAGLLGVPLMRMDFSALYNKYIGETEKNLRESLSAAEVLAPCVLWMDEIEKALAQSGSDDGTSRRLLGTLLTWMAERAAPVFIAATANDISQLPPELMRKGRLDEIFFVDLPDAEVRAQIFAIHLRKRGINPNKLDLTRLAEASHDFSGAEIEQAVVAAQHHARATGDAVDTALLIEELEGTSPLAVIKATEIATLRHWAAERTKAAH